MIKAEQKPMDEIFRYLDPYNKILLAGCGACVTVCHAGGEKEVGLLASSLRMARQKIGKPMEVLRNPRPSVRTRVRIGAIGNRRKGRSGRLHRLRGGGPDPGPPFSEDPCLSGSQYHVHGRNHGPWGLGGTVSGLWKLRPRKDRRDLSDCPLCETTPQRTLRRFLQGEMRNQTETDCAWQTDL